MECVRLPAASQMETGMMLEIRVKSSVSDGCGGTDEIATDPHK